MQSTFKATSTYLGMECMEIDMSAEDIWAIYKSIRQEGLEQNYTPCIVVIDILGVLEETNDRAKEEKGSIEAFTKYCLENYEKPEATNYFNDMEEWYNQVLEEYGAYNLEQKETCTITSTISPTLEFCFPGNQVYIVKVPTNKPYEIFAYLPMGGWDMCPTNEIHIAIAKQWYEKYGAVPCSIGYSTVQYYVPNLVETGDKELAKQMFKYCPDMIFGSDRSLKDIENINQYRHTWSFWWD